MMTCHGAYESKQPLGDASASGAVREEGLGSRSSSVGEMQRMSLRNVPPLPGLLVRQLVLDNLGIKPIELARAMGISNVRVHHILNGKAPITANVALRLGVVTATDPAFWAKAQLDYALHGKRQELSATLEMLPVLVDSSSARTFSAKHPAGGARHGGPLRSKESKEKGDPAMRSPYRHDSGLGQAG
jgi:addiction module HigA family antidote